MNYLKWGRSTASATPDSGSGSKRSADTMQSLPASAPALKLHKDDSGDIVTAATVTAEVPTDPATTVPAAPALVQVPKAVWEAVTTGLEAVTTRLGALERETSELKKQLADSTQNTLARENVLRDTHRQELASVKDDVEFLSQRVRSKNMVLHGVPDTASVSKPADLERFVKHTLDEVTPGRTASKPSQSITAVSHIGRPGTGNRSVLVEYASSQAKHSAYALSKELRRRGFHLADELTPKQMHAQKAMEADASALRSKGFRPWFRRGALYYSNRGVQRQCRQGEAVKVPTCSVPPPPPAPPAPTRNAARRSPAHRRDNGVTAPVNSVLGSPRPPRSASPTYAQAVRSDPVASAASIPVTAPTPTPASSAPGPSSPQ